MRTVTIYTDGACSCNPGPGGWGAVLLYEKTPAEGGGLYKKEISGSLADTTNNVMELTAVIEGLRMLKEPCIVELWSDSKYVLEAIGKGWAASWKARGWRRSDNKPAKNKELWDELLKVIAPHTVHCHWVEGHSNDTYNNRCDALAVEARLKLAAQEAEKAGEEG